MWKRDQMGEAFARFRLAIAYIILVAGVVVAFLYMQAIADVVEREALVRAFDNCQALNEVRSTLREVLERVGSERAFDFEDPVERREFFDGLADDIQDQECPPEPPPRPRWAPR